MNKNMIEAMEGNGEFVGEVRGTDTITHLAIDDGFWRIHREELARLRADSAELARVRGVTVISTMMLETAEAARFASHLVGNQVHLDPNKHYRIDFVVLGEPAEIKQSIPEGFALVPVEQAKHAERYQWVRQADAAVIETLAWTADSADDFDRRVDEEISAPKGDSHE